MFKNVELVRFEHHTGGDKVQQVNGVAGVGNSATVE